MIFRSPRRGGNQRQAVQENVQPRNQNFPAFPPINLENQQNFQPRNEENNERNNANRNHSGTQMDEQEIHNQLLNVNEQLRELNAEDEHRLLDESNRNRGANRDENLVDPGLIRQNQIVGNVTPRENDNFLTSTPNISPIHHAQRQLNFEGNRRNWERPRDARGRFIRLEANDQEADNVVCYNCNEPGHVSRNCNKTMSRQNRNEFPSSFPQQNQQQTPNTVATGANRVFLNSKNGMPSAGRSQNFLKQNCIRMEEEVKTDATVAGVKQNRGKSSNRKMVTVELKVFETPATAMLDGGAQISLMGGKFFYELITNRKLELHKNGFNRVSARISDVNGKELECFGVISLPVDRDGCKTTNVCFHITSAPFGFDLLIGTNALRSLGFCLFDIPNKEMINFEEINPQKKNTVSVIYQTTLKPFTMQFVTLSVGNEWNGKDVVITAVNEKSPHKLEPTVGKVEEGKITVPILNTSDQFVQIPEKEIIAELAPALLISETENSVISSFLVNNFTVSSIEAKNNARDNGIRGFLKSQSNIMSIEEFT
ncbi:hypothetical protein niasHT_012139 [Heterodera trifolii]|uniref:CCHC-type domain-containing protein n=1 Tax=Heterodera trifolii TaxID=157864 RepID=A0ABD2LAA4_9BILA